VQFHLVLGGQARQRVTPHYSVFTKHADILAGEVTEWSLRTQANAEYCVAQQFQASDSGRRSLAVAYRGHGNVGFRLARACQKIPSCLQSVFESALRESGNRAAAASYQARLAGPRFARTRNRYAVAEQTIENGFVRLNGETLPFVVDRRYTGPEYPLSDSARRSGYSPR
jgi:hypothetical protein